MKKCTKCLKHKELLNFGKYKYNKDGLKNWCKSCVSLYNSEFLKNNKEKVKRIHDDYRKANREKRNFWNAKRRASELTRTPKWLTEEHLNQIKLEYELASWCSKVTGISYHVDHIIPLQGKTVSGLHVPWNLQVIPAKDNIIKGNR